jgi:hypothetical protein
MTEQVLTPYQSQFYAWLLTRRAAGDTVEVLASTLVDAQVDLNPHQVEAVLFACKNPLSDGVNRVTASACFFSACLPPNSRLHGWRNVSNRVDITYRNRSPATFPRG